MTVQLDVAPVESPDTIPGPPDTTGLDTLAPDASQLQEAESTAMSESAQTAPPDYTADTLPGPEDTTGLDTLQPDTSFLEEVESLFVPESALPESIPPESLGTE